MKIFIIIFAILYCISAIINLREVQKNKSGDLVGRILIVIAPIANMLFTLVVLSSITSDVSEEEYYRNNTKSK